MNECPIKTDEHHAHDEKIRELEAFKKAVLRTPRVMAERIVKLEKGLLELNRRYERKKQELAEANKLLKKWM